jgi:hypothetical protein
MREPRLWGPVVLSDVVIAGQGGLGNRLFQLATAEALAVRHGGRVLLVPSESDDATALRMLVGDFPEPSPIALLRCGVVPPGPRVPLTTAVAAAQLLGVAARRRIGRDGAYQPPHALPRRGPVTIVGSVQHPAHFARGVTIVVERILKHQGAASRLSNGTMPQDRTTVHLRRGDYVRLGHALSTQYYLDAVEEMVRRSPGMSREVEIISDDPMAAEGLAVVLERDGWSCASGASRVRSSGPELAVEEFWRLAVARRLVMSNSTFCWWAAVVGDAQSPGRPVVFPSAWIGFGDAGLSRPDWLNIASTTDAHPPRFQTTL